VTMDEVLVNVVSITHPVLIIKIDQLILYREIHAVCYEIHAEHSQTLCRQNVRLFNVEPCGTYNNHWAVKAHSTHRNTYITFNCTLLRIRHNGNVSNTKMFIINQNDNS
jgi:hypothetical protein